VVAPFFVTVRPVGLPRSDVYSRPVEPLTLNGVFTEGVGEYVPVNVPVMRPVDPNVPDCEYSSVIGPVVESYVPVVTVDVVASQNPLVAVNAPLRSLMSAPGIGLANWSETA
jgi:hypothetical protein